MSLYRLTNVLLDVVITIVTAFLGFRLLLKLFGASEENPFVHAVYVVSVPLLAPFAGIFPSLALENGFMLEFATIFALVVYAIIAHIILTIVRGIAYAAFRRRHLRGVIAATQQ